MMTTAQLEKKLLKYTEGLSKETLQEIIDFIQFLKQKEIQESADDNITAELSMLSFSQTAHLENEFKDYKDLYPRE
jgi:methionyl-tRNA formyltransferase